MILGLILENGKFVSCDYGTHVPTMHRLEDFGYDGGYVLLRDGDEIDYIEGISYTSSLTRSQIDTLFGILTEYGLILENCSTTEFDEVFCQFKLYN
jgi:hypothetical protein